MNTVYYFHGGTTDIGAVQYKHSLMETLLPKMVEFYPYVVYAYLNGRVYSCYGYKNRKYIIEELSEGWTYRQISRVFNEYLSLGQPVP